MKEKKKSAFRSVTLRLGFALLLEFILMETIGWRGNEIYYLFTGDVADEVTAGVIDCFLYLFSFMVPVALFRLISIGKKPEQMHLGVRFNTNGLLWIGVGLGFISALAYIGNLFFAQVDFSWIFADTSVGTAPKTVVEFISTAVVPAVAEEFLFRGCVLSNLQPFGKQAAVFGSAFLFAMMHGNPLQFFYAFCAGLILGTVFVETGSIWPGMFLHLFNNFISVILTVLLAKADDYTYNLLYYLWDTVFILGGIACFVILLLRNKGKLFSGESAEEAREKATPAGFFSVTVILFIVACGLRALNILYYAFLYV